MFLDAIFRNRHGPEIRVFESLKEPRLLNTKIVLGFKRECRLVYEKSYVFTKISINNAHFSSDYSLQIGRLEFTKQPPPNLRKSNFFHFMLQLFDR